VRSRLLALAIAATAVLGACTGRETSGGPVSGGDAPDEVVLVTHDQAIAGRARRQVRMRDGLVESDTGGGAEAAAVGTP